MGRLLTFVSFLFFCSAIPALAQEECRPPEVVFNANADNLFTLEQEQYLGEILQERSRRDFRVIDDPALTAYIRRIGERIEKHLPESGITFRYHVVDQPEANAFIHAGGYVYVTRKLIALAKSEDELAWVIGHEMGHGVMRHHTVDYTKSFKKILGIEKLGDRQDVFNKYNRYLDTFRTKRVSFKRKHQSRQQYEADEIGLYATIAAGYEGKEFLNFWKRLSETEEGKGNWFTDIFGGQSVSEKRLEKMMKTFEGLPVTCKQQRSGDVASFEQWQADVVNYTGLGGKEEFHGLVSSSNLIPRLLPQVHTIKFSPNGKYVLAQDDSGINVLKAQPFEFIFRIEADDALPAAFTESSDKIVFTNANHRVQKWDILKQAAESVHEVFVRVGCWESKLSPDGKYLACYNRKWALRIYDVQSNKVIFERLKFYVPGIAEYYLWLRARNLADGKPLKMFDMQYSPNSRFLILGGRYGGTVRFGWGGDVSKTFGFDLQAKKEIKLHKNLKQLIYGAFTFESNDRVVGVYGDKEEKSGVFEFPSGKRLDTFYLNGRQFSRPHKGDFLIVKPVNNAPVGVYDLKNKRFHLANKTPAMDIYGDKFVAERKTGEIGLYDVANGKVLSRVDVPDIKFGTLRSATISPDGKWVAASVRSRGSLWNADSGSRVFFIRGFRNGFFAEGGRMFTDFPKQKNMARMVGIMDGAKATIQQGYKIESDSARLYGRYIVNFVTDEKKKEVRDKDKTEVQRRREEDGVLEDVGWRKGTLEFIDAVTGIVLWQKRFDDVRPRIEYSKEYDSIVFVYLIKSKTAKNIINSDPVLKKKREKLGDKDGDYLLQIVEPSSGAVKRNVFLETGEGSFRVQDVYVSGDWLVIDDTNRRILLYSKQAERVRFRFFGYRNALSTVNNLIVVENEPGRLTAYDLNSGESIKNLRFTKRISYMRFLEGEQELMVLTEDQMVYRFKVSELASRTP